MKCLISGPNVKIFAKAIHSLAKIGDELHFEPMEDGLVLKTVNSSRSAYATFRFRIPFFLNFQRCSENTVLKEVDPEEIVKCKLPVKSILTVFRSITHLEKSVETCKISILFLEGLLVVELKCKHGIVKLFNLRYFECESVEAEFSKEGYSSRFTCSSRFYSEALQSFHSSIAEVTWSLEAERVHLSNYLDDEQDVSKCVRTEVTLAREEFEDFNVAASTQVTFCLRELRAILSFAEVFMLELQCRMEGSGHPVLFSLDKDSSFSADFLLATLSPTVEPTQSSAPTLSNHTTPRHSILRNRTDTRSASRMSYSPCIVANVSDARCSRLDTSPPREEEPAEEVVSAPAPKRARARHIFQRCLAPSQDPMHRLGEVLAPDSDAET